MKKKSIALLIGLFFVFSFAFAATAFAIQAEIPSGTSAIVAAGTTSIRLSGDLRVRGWFKDNIGAQDSGGAVSDNTFILPEGLTGYVTPKDAPLDHANNGYYDERARLAVDASSGDVSGRIHLESDLHNQNTSVWGDPAKGGGFDSKQSNGVGILEAWINYAGSGLLGVPAGMKVGHMPLALGPAPLFFDHRKFGDDAIVAYTSPRPNMHLTALTIKASEQSPVVFNDNHDIDVYAAVANGEFAKQELGVDYSYVDDPSGTFLGPFLTAAGSPVAGSSLSLQDLGLFASGNLSGVNYTAEGDFQFGKLASNFDASGYALWLNLGYKLAPVNLRATVAYGSGDANPGNAYHQFINFLSTSRRYTLVYEYQVATAAGTTHTGIANTQVYNIGADYNPLAALKLSLDYYYLRANSVAANVSKDLGSEVDFAANYQITKNLTYFFNAGVLAEGNFYKDTYGAAGDTTPAVVMHGVELAF